jgi:hypothetical protein
MYLRDDHWQQQVDGLIRASALVVLHAGDSSGLMWELQRVVGADRPDRVILCLPVDRAGSKLKRQTTEARYARFRDATASIFPRPLPRKSDGCAFLYFQRDWTPQLLRFSETPTVDSPTQSLALNVLSKQFRRRVVHA